MAMSFEGGHLAVSVSVAGHPVFVGFGGPYVTKLEGLYLSEPEGRSSRCTGRELEVALSWHWT